MCQIKFPKELLESLNLDVPQKTEEQEKIENIAYKNGTYLIISKMAYLTGVKREIFESDRHSPQMDIFNNLEKDKNARIIRNLCMLRNALERNYNEIYNVMGVKSICHDTN